MIISVPKETYTGERRVALVPASVPPLIKGGASVQIEAGAGLAAGFTDNAYREAGAEIISAVAADGQLTITYRAGPMTSVRIFDGKSGEMVREIPVMSE